MSNVVQNLTPQPALELVEPRGPATERGAVERRREIGRLQHHRLMLQLSIASLCLAFLLEVSPDGVHIAFRGFSDYPLPETCGSKLLFGAECPGCGLTRSFIWAARGEWGRSIQVNRIGLAVLLACIAQIPYRMAMIRAERKGDFAQRKWAGYFGSILIAVLLGNWLLKQFGF